jgi:hypothetical protein
MDPIIDMKVPKNLVELFNSKDDRAKKALKNLPEFYKQAVQGASTGGSNRGGGGRGGGNRIALDPASTVYIGRKTFSYSSIGTSAFRRLIPLWIMEKALMRGTMEQAYARQRAILHITMGDEVWEPTDQEMQAGANLFATANLDPTGAVVVTRQGVLTNEVRRGDDLWKHCLAGDTLIPTEEGIFRIDELEDRINNSSKPLRILGGKGPAKVAEWTNAGKKPVFKYRTANGQTITATKEHRFMVLENNEVVWKKGKDLQLGDLLCATTDSLTRQSEYKLPPFEANEYGNEKELRFPKYMNTDLAFILGLMVSEGSFDKTQSHFGNSNKKLADRFATIMLEQFGIEARRGTRPPGIESAGMTSTKEFYDVGYCSTLLSKFWTHIGLKNHRKKKSPSYYKEVPYTVLQANEECQLAYLAGYIEGDGTISETNISIASSSKKNLRQMQTMMASHGCLSHIHNNVLTFNRGATHSLNSKLQPFLTHKIKEVATPQWPQHTAGIPTAGIRAFLNGRKVGRRVGVILRTDDGKDIEVEGYNIFNREKKRRS